MASRGSSRGSRRLKRPWATCARTFLLLGVLTACTKGQAPRSVVLITVDTLRADHLSAYGYELPTSPSIERLAARGALFTRAFSASSVTAPSITSILTGRYPSFHTVGLVNGSFRLDADTTTLAEILRQHGYPTCAVVSNPVLSASNLGLDQGFDSYDDRFEDRELVRDRAERRADKAVDVALQWLQDRQGEPFFLWLHLQDPHGPYDPPAGWDRFRDRPYPDGERPLAPGTDHSGYAAIPKYQVYYEERHRGGYERRYDSEIAFMDRELGRFLAHAEEQEGLRNTLVLLTADHGEAFGEDEFYFAHGHSVGQDQVHVPLILAGPGVPTERVITTPVSNVAIFATVLDYLDLETPPSAAQPSLLELLQDQERRPPPIFVESLSQTGIVHESTFLRHDRRPSEDTAFWSMRNPNSGGFWKPLGRQVIRLLDTTGDRSDASLEDLEAQLAEFEREARASRARMEPLQRAQTLSPNMKQALRSLGYLQ